MEQLGLPLISHEGAPGDSAAVVLDAQVVATVVGLAPTDVRVRALAETLLGFAVPGYESAAKIPARMRALAEEKARTAMFELAVASEHLPSLAFELQGDCSRCGAAVNSPGPCRG